MATQLRDYRIIEGSLNQFVDEWRRRIAPLRRDVGFSIDGAWTVEGEDRFVWLLSFPGDWTTFDEADRGYYASPQRAKLDPDPARLIQQQALARLAEVQPRPPPR